jgi:hypothetical protein
MPGNGEVCYPEGGNPTHGHVTGFGGRQHHHQSEIRLCSYHLAYLEVLICIRTDMG